MPHRFPVKFVAAAIGIAAITDAAAGQLRVGQWNVTSYTATSGRDGFFQTAIYAVAPNGLQFAPDVLTIQEIVENVDGQTQQQAGNAAVASFLTLLNTAPGSPGDWAAAPYQVNGGDTGNALFYRTTRVVLISTTALTTDTGTGPTQAPRDTQRWLIRPIGYSGLPAQLYIYGGHFKAGSTAADQLRRNPEGRRIRIDANALPDTTNFMVCADFNAQNSAQDFYEYMVEFSNMPAADRLFTADATGRFFDPISSPGTWENNNAFRLIHTQDPAAGNQMDSRHDQILIAGNLRDGQGMEYMPAVPGGNIFLAYYTPSVGNTWDDPNHSYRAWGNDGTAAGGSLPIAGNTMVGPVIAQALQSSAAGGGHLPILLDLQVPAKVSAPSSVNFGNVALGSTAQQTIQISNGANLALWSKDGTGRGIDILNYSLSASAGFTVSPGPFTDAAGGMTNSHLVTMSTTSTGPKSGTLTVTSDDPDFPTLVINLSGTVAATYDYDVDNDGLVNINDLYRWYGLFTDVDGNGSVDLSDVTALRAELRRLEVPDMAPNRM